AATDVRWVLGDATAAPLCPEGPTTVLMNPPFGAQSGNEHADREFLATAAETADVSYSIHNAGSDAFVESFAADAGGEVTHAFEAELDLPRRFEFHDDDSKALTVEVFRIGW
ncbi:RNA methyltransferase, partial [Halobacteriales archaeon QH_1_68_42]